jgi:hypothetical protein
MKTSSRCSRILLLANAQHAILRDSQVGHSGSCTSIAEGHGITGQDTAAQHILAFFARRELSFGAKKSSVMRRFERTLSL